MTGTAVSSCTGCSGGKKVRFVGDGNIVQFNGVGWGNGGTVLLIVAYVNGDSTSRKAQVSVNGATAWTVTCPSTHGWSTVGTFTLKITLRSGTHNRITIGNSSAWGPDLDRITIQAP
jgi:hypothetical protein